MARRPPDIEDRIARGVLRAFKARRRERERERAKRERERARERARAAKARQREQEKARAKAARERARAAKARQREQEKARAKAARERERERERARERSGGLFDKIKASLSPAYRRRLERAAAAGKTRQEARGHKAGEAARRAERERAEAATSGKLTTPQRRRIREFVKRQARKADIDPDDAWDDYRDLFEAPDGGGIGYAGFLQIEQEQKRLESQGDQRIARGKGTGIVGSLEDLQILADRYEAPEWMLYYH